MIFITQNYSLAQYHLPVGIKTNQNRKHDGKGDQGGSSITDERQRNADHRGQPDSHAQVDGDMKKED
jgi:hypothetical protein